MQYVEIPNPDAKLLVDWTLRQRRARQIMIRRYLAWQVRKSAEAPQIIANIDAILTQNARNYTKSAP